MQPQRRCQRMRDSRENRRARCGSGQRTARPNPVLRRPNEGVQDVAVWEARVAGEADYVAALVNGGRCIPPLSAEIAQINDLTVLPEHSMLRGMPAHSLVADARNSDNLTVIVNRGSSSGGIRTEERKCTHTVVVRVPDNRPKLQNLRRNTGRIMAGILSPADYLAKVVRSGGKAVVSTQSGKRSHLTVLPNKTTRDKSDIIRRRE